MAKMWCPLCAITGAKETKPGLCIHQKVMLGLIVIIAVVVIIKLLA